MQVSFFVSGTLFRVGGLVFRVGFLGWPGPGHNGRHDDDGHDGPNNPHPSGDVFHGFSLINMGTKVWNKNDHLKKQPMQQTIRVSRTFVFGHNMKL